MGFSCLASQSVSQLFHGPAQAPALTPPRDPSAGSSVLYMYVPTRRFRIALRLHFLVLKPVAR